MKLALIQCPGWGRECPPYSLACLAAYARASGHEAVCFDLNNAFYHHSPGYERMWRDKDYYSFWENPSRVAELVRDNEAVVERSVAQILASGARVAGFTTHTTSFLVSLEIARRLKRSDPSLIVVFGGPQCSREQASFRLAADPAVDAVAVGEGEETLRELLDVVQKDGRLKPMPGLILRWEGEVRDCGDRELISDISALPFADYSDFAEDIVGKRYSDPRRLEIFDSRGCVRTCHFCSEWQFWKRFRTMSGDRMFAELEHQVRLFPQVDYFYFIGSLVNGSVKDLRRFCDRMIESGLKVRWAGQAVVSPSMDKSLMDRMAQAGCVWLGFGIESGSETLRWRINKKFTNANAFETLKAAHSAGINTQVNIMFGTPTETREEFQETMRFLVHNRHHIDTVLASQSFCVIDKNTALHARPEQFGVSGEQHHLFWESNGGENDYPERFRRYEEFCQLALQLRIPETSGILAVKPDKWSLLGEYHAYKGRALKALACYRRSLRLEGVNKASIAALADCYKALGRPEKALGYLQLALDAGPGEDRYDEQIQAKISELPKLNGGAQRALEEIRREKWTAQLSRKTPATPISA